MTCSDRNRTAFILIELLQYIQINDLFAHIRKMRHAEGKALHIIPSKDLEV